MSTHQLCVIYQPISTLKPRSTNPRTHPQKQITQIANAIRRFGFTNPVLVDDSNGIIAGHGRVEAAKEVGLTRARVRYLVRDDQVMIGIDRDLHRSSSSRRARPR